MFVEDCNRYREYIHLLSFNYDFHLCKAQLYLNGSQRIFNKGYGVTNMLKGLLLEYSKCPLFARNRLCNGNILLPGWGGGTPLYKGRGYSSYLLGAKKAVLGFFSKFPTSTPVLFIFPPTHPHPDFTIFRLYTECTLSKITPNSLHTSKKSQRIRQKKKFSINIRPWAGLFKAQIR